VTEVSCQGVQSGAIAPADEASKGFAPLVGAEMPRSPVMERYVDESCEWAVKVIDEIGGAADVEAAVAVGVRHQPQLVPSR
jgi:hypothetical protein